MALCRADFSPLLISLVLLGGVGFFFLFCLVVFFSASEVCVRKHPGILATFKAIQAHHAAKLWQSLSALPPVPLPFSFLLQLWQAVSLTWGQPLPTTPTPPLPPPGVGT